MVREKTKMEKMLISGVAADKNVAKIRVAGLGNDPESTFRLLNLLDRNNLNIDVMIQSLGKDGTKSVSFTVAKPDMLRTIDVLNDNKDLLGIKNWIMTRTWQRFPSSEPVSAPIRAWLPNVRRARQCRNQYRDGYHLGNPHHCPDRRSIRRSGDACDP